MPRDKKHKNQYPAGYEHISFFFQTQLTQERKDEINEWVGSLTDHQRKMLDDIMTNEQEEGQFSADEGC